MGRPKGNSLKVNIMIDADLYDQLRIMLLDPRNGRLRYGAMQKIFNGLLRRFLSKMNEPGVDPVKLLAAYGIVLGADDTHDTSSTLND